MRYLKNKRLGKSRYSHIQPRAHNFKVQREVIYTCSYGDLYLVSNVKIYSALIHSHKMVEIVNCLRCIDGS